jgi:BirA family biotin operon repressor/biotin-[acetyl-CoA-carboxylase] ligase
LAGEDILSGSAITTGLATRYMGQHVVHVESTTSTMDLADQQAADGAMEGTVVVADSQTEARGRFRRRWIAPPGTELYCSIILRPRPEHLLQLTMVAALAVAEAVQVACDIRTAIKWPNDVEVGGRKIAGILIDNAMLMGNVDYSIMGIGINAALDPRRHPEIAETATSLATEAGRPVARLPVLRALLTALEPLYDRVQAGESLVPEWKARLSTLGEQVRVAWPGDALGQDSTQEGVAEDVDGEGALILRRADGSQVRLIAGEVTLRPR